MNFIYNLSTWDDFLFNGFSITFNFSNFFILMFFTFIVGCTGLVWRANNLLLVLIFGELMLVSLVFGFILVSKFWVLASGQVYALAILNSAAVESAIGLVLIINIYRTTGSVSVSFLKCLRG